MRNKNIYTYVADSGIHGKGLFAKQDIKKNTLLGIIETKESQQDGAYVLWSQDMEECVEVICDFKYINHSDNPNVAYFDDNTVVSIQNIKAHTELTHNYGTEDAFTMDDTSS